MQFFFCLFSELCVMSCSTPPCAVPGTCAALADVPCVHCSTSAFQPYRPTAVRAAPGADAAATAAGYASKPLTIADPRAAHTTNGLPSKDGSADWKARLLQRFHSAHAGTAGDA